MKKNLAIVLGCIILGLIGGCSTSVVPKVELPIQMGIEESTQDETVEEPPQNKVEWIITNTESRAASNTPTWETDTLNYVTLEIYKVPNRNGKFIHDEKELLETRKLYRGDVLPFSSAKDYNWEYITAIRVVEFNSYNAFYAERNEINIFDYEGTIGMEQVHFYNCNLKTTNVEAYGDSAGHKTWKMWSNRIVYRDDLEGYENYYYFLDKNEDTMSKFYVEHKDDGRIIWNK